MKRAIFGAMVVMFGTSAAFGVSASDNEYHEVTENSNAEVTVEFNGEVQYSDDGVYSVLLPTDKQRSFKLDTRGGYIGGGTDIPAYGDLKVINESSVAISLTVEMVATSNSDRTIFIPLSDGCKSSAIASVSGDTNNNAILCAVPSSVNVKDINQVFSPSMGGFVFDRTASRVDFLLSAKGAGAGVGEGNGTAFQLVGYVNPNADWSDWAKPPESEVVNTIGAEMVFRFSKAAVGGAQSGYAGMVYGLMKTGEADYDNIMAVGDFGFASGAITVTKARGAQVSFELPLFKTGGYGISKIEYRPSPEYEFNAYAGGMYSERGGVITMSAQSVNPNYFGTRCIRVTLSNGLSDTVMVTFVESE